MADQWVLLATHKGDDMFLNPSLQSFNCVKKLARLGNSVIECVALRIIEFSSTGPTTKRVSQVKVFESTVLDGTSKLVSVEVGYVL